jgi:hypothetical protein
VSISPVGPSAGYVAPVRPQVAAVRAAIVARVGTDADGDSDGSKGGKVDVRA